jgi:hypothetical protein
VRNLFRTSGLVLSASALRHSCPASAADWRTVFYSNNLDFKLNAVISHATRGPCNFFAAVISHKNVIWSPVLYRASDAFKCRSASMTRTTPI